jgi:hypothetical protein
MIQELGNLAKTDNAKVRTDAARHAAGYAAEIVAFNAVRLALSQYVYSAITDGARELYNLITGADIQPKEDDDEEKASFTKQLLAESLVDGTTQGLGNVGHAIGAYAANATIPNNDSYGDPLKKPLVTDYTTFKNIYKNDDLLTRAKKTTQAYLPALSVVPEFMNNINQNYQIISNPNSTPKEKALWATESFWQIANVTGLGQADINRANDKLRREVVKELKERGDTFVLPKKGSQGNNKFPTAPKFGSMPKLPSSFRKKN